MQLSIISHPIDAILLLIFLIHGILKHIFFFVVYFPYINESARNNCKWISLMNHANPVSYFVVQHYRAKIDDLQKSVIYVIQIDSLFLSFSYNRFNHLVHFTVSPLHQIVLLNQFVKFPQ